MKFNLLFPFYCLFFINVNKRIFKIEYMHLSTELLEYGLNCHHYGGKRRGSVRRNPQGNPLTHTPSNYVKELKMR